MVREVYNALLKLPAHLSPIIFMEVEKINRTDYNIWKKIIESKRKKEFKILLKAMQDMNKTISKLKKQEEFLNELLDKRENDFKRFMKFQEKLMKTMLKYAELRDEEVYKTLTEEDDIHGKSK